MNFNIIFIIFEIFLILNSILNLIKNAYEKEKTMYKFIDLNKKYK